MSTTEKLFKARMGMLALAEQLNNVSAACRRAGISRSDHYEIKEAFEKLDAQGLAPQTRRKPRMPSHTPPEAPIREMTERYPTYSYLRISDQLKLVGIGVSPSTVRAVWQRHGLTLRIHRLLWLEQKTAAQGGILTERQIRLLQKHRGRTADPEQHVEAPYPGYLLCQDLLHQQDQRDRQDQSAERRGRAPLAGLRQGLPLQGSNDRHRCSQR